MSESYEHCMECDSLTGRAGRAEDSLYHGYIGPFCEDCFEDWPDEQVAQITTLRQQLTTTKAENEALRAQIKETEEKGRVLMDMCRFWKARVTELSEALQVAVDTPELGGGTWYDMAVAALAERAGGE